MGVVTGSCSNIPLLAPLGSSSMQGSRLRPLLQQLGFHLHPPKEWSPLGGAGVAGRLLSSRLLCFKSWDTYLYILHIFFIYLSISLLIHLYIHMHVCMYACMHVCMYVWMDGCMYMLLKKSF